MARVMFTISASVMVKVRVSVNTTVRTEILARFWVTLRLVFVLCLI